MPFNNDSHSEILAKSAGFAEVFTQEVFDYLKSLLPTPGQYTEFHERLAASYTSSLTGDPENVKAFEMHRQVVNENLAVMNLFIKAAAIKDPTLPGKLRMGSTPERSAPATHTIGDPHGLRVTFSRKGGQPYFSFNKIPRAKIYEIWVCDSEPSVDANWRLLDSSSTCLNIPLKGLNRTKTNFIKVRGKSGSIVGPWSLFISIDPS